MVPYIVWAGNQPSPQQPRSRCALFLPLNSFWRPQCPCLPARVPSVTSTKSLFTVSQVFMCKTAFVRLHAKAKHHSKLHTKCLQSSRKGFKMADGRRARASACVGPKESVFCWLRCWQHPNDRSIQTSNKACIIPGEAGRQRLHGCTRTLPGRHLEAQICACASWLRIIRMRIISGNYLGS